MPSNTGLDLASQTGQQAIVSALNSIMSALIGSNETVIAKRLCGVLVTKNVITAAEYETITGEAYSSGN